MQVQVQAKLTSKGQITIPREIRALMGVNPGDRLIFESDGNGVRVLPVRTESRFKKYQGIGNPGIAPGRKGIKSWIRDLRGR
ncbi:MAG: AbrB/MazE/SpoVT family DNA-binding domain-containing protein [Bryobacteraceae bacterium]